MEKLLRGIEHFQKSVFPKDRELYHALAKGQDPYALVITCSDSRVVPNQIMQTQPGDLFVIRNAGNIVPAHSANPGGTTATIEYAVSVLKVKAIIIWGHSNCGAMKGLLHPEKTAALRAVSAWLQHAERARAIVEDAMPDASDDAKVIRLVRENVAAQLDNIRTHPCVAVALAKSAITLHGWVFDIESGQLEAYRDSTWGPLIEPP